MNEAQYIVDALINGLLVALGLFVLWSFVGHMRNVNAATRLGWAAVAGAVSFAATLMAPVVI